MVKYIETKSILSKLRGTDSFFGITYNMNLYRGCQHACIYCDTRSDCYQIHDISTISIKKNALELLARELSVKRKNKATIGTGSMNDPYMPLEKEKELTRKALQLIGDYKFPAHIITKSDLVTRDIDVLEEISKTYAAVSFTITSADNLMSNQIEPYAPSTSERFKAIEKLTARGIYTGITLMPMLPFINDTPENIESIIRRAKDAGVSYIIPMFGVTLRKGSRDYFYKALDEKFPNIKMKYQKTYGEQYECYSPNHKKLMNTFLELTDKLGIETQMQFYKPETYIQQSLF